MDEDTLSRVMDAQLFFEAMKADLKGTWGKSIRNRGSNWRGMVYSWGNHRVRLRYHKLWFNPLDWTIRQTGWAANLDGSDVYRVCEVKLYTSLMSTHAVAEVTYRSDGSAVWNKPITDVMWMKLKLRN